MDSDNSSYWRKNNRLQGWTCIASSATTIWQANFGTSAFRRRTGEARPTRSDGFSSGLPLDEAGTSSMPTTLEVTEHSLCWPPDDSTGS